MHGSDDGGGAHGSQAAPRRAREPSNRRPRQCTSKTGRLFGRLSLEALPLHEPILVATFASPSRIGGLALLGALTYFRLWGYLWRDWFTSIDHKKIGIMYMVLGLVMLLRGFADAIMMRAAAGDRLRRLRGLPATPHHYDQIFTAHGVIMIFFVAMPLVTGLMNYVVPLQIGARDVAFPFLNNFSFWMTAAGAVLVMVSLFVGEFARTGWLAYPPLSGIDYSPDVGVDYYIWALQVAGVGTLLSGVNLIATIVKMRAPGMTLMKMPVFTWTALCTNVLIVAAFPVLTAVLALLSLDRYVGTNFFTNDLGGNADDVREPDLDLGPSGGLHPDPAGCSASSPKSSPPSRGKRLFGYALDGLRDGRHHDPVVPRVAAPLLHDGLGRERQLVLRHHDDDHLDPDRARRSSTGCSPCTAAASASRCR